LFIVGPETFTTDFWRLSLLTFAFRTMVPIFTLLHVQGDLGGNFIIFGGDGTGHCEKEDYMNMCLNLNGYRDGAA
jgi:hypothetical protein